MAEMEMNEMQDMQEDYNQEEAESAALDAIGSDSSGLETVFGAGVGFGMGALASAKYNYAKGVKDYCEMRGLDPRKEAAELKEWKKAKKKKAGLVDRIAGRLGFERKKPEPEVIETKDDKKKSKA